MAPIEPEFFEEVAIIGLSGRFPGAVNIEQFWQNLRDGVEALSWFSDDDVAAHHSPHIRQAPNFVKAGFILDDADVEHFDAAFFDVSPRQAQWTDPQQRLFLECAWEALEHAGLDVTTYAGLIGVFAGASVSTYYLYHLLTAESTSAAYDLQMWMGNEKDYLATQTAKLRTPATQAAVTSPTLCPITTSGITPQDCHNAARAYSKANRAGWV